MIGPPSQDMMLCFTVIIYLLHIAIVCEVKLILSSIIGEHVARFQFLMLKVIQQ